MHEHLFGDITPETMAEIDRWYREDGAIDDRMAEREATESAAPEPDEVCPGCHGAGVVSRDCGQHWRGPEWCDCHDATCGICSTGQRL